MAGLTGGQAQALYENTDPLTGRTFKKDEQIQTDSVGANVNLLTPADTSNAAELLAGYKSKMKGQRARAKEEEQKRILQAEQKAYIEQIQSSPWTQMGNALASQYMGAANQAQQLMSGATYPQAAQQASDSAQALLGLAPGSSAGSWLAQNQAAASAADAPLTAAMQNEAAAYSAWGGPISQAVAQFGQSNALEQLTAPEQSWLSALAQHITSNLSYYGVVPSADLPTLQSAQGLIGALKSSGGFGGVSGQGLTPLSSLTTTGQQAPKSTGPTGLGGLGYVPTSSTPAPSGTTAPGG